MAKKVSNRKNKTLAILMLAIIVLLIIVPFIYVAIDSRLNEKEEELYIKAEKLIYPLLDENYDFNGIIDDEDKLRATLFSYNYDGSKTKTLKQVYCKDIYPLENHYEIIIEGVKNYCQGSAMTFSYSDANKYGKTLFGKNYELPKKSNVGLLSTKDYIPSIDSFAILSSSASSELDSDYWVEDVYTYKNLLYIVVSQPDGFGSSNYYQFVFEKENGNYIYKTSFKINGNVYLN